MSTRGPSLTVIVGCMFSGKSEELLRCMKRAAIAQLRVLLVKPAIDTRNMATRICSRDGRCMDAINVSSTAEIPAAAATYDVVGIDEAQFFDPGIVAAVRTLYAAGKRIVVAGLDTDHRDDPFGSIPALLCIPEADLVRLRAVCMRCQGEATRTFRKSTSQAQVEIGDGDKYEALCYACYGPAVAERDGTLERASARATVPA
ncbi:MAG: thymidine kinase [bacterium]|nr:thymidine kinase [bacterium]